MLNVDVYQKLIIFLYLITVLDFHNISKSVVVPVY